MLFRSRPLVAILENSEEHARIAERAEGLRAGECSGCPYYELCYGGCPDDVWLNTGDVRGRSGWCESYRLLFDTLASRLRQPRPVRRRVPRKQLWPAARVTVQPVVEGGSVVSAPGDGFIETWLLPTEDGRAFRFDSGLDRPKGRRPPRIRLLVHNRQVKALVLWEDLLRARGVSVVLFESEDLEPSLGLLNSLGAVVELDVIRILEGPTGQAALCRIVECFVTDPQWKAQILPFSNVLANAMHERHSPFLTRWGLRPGNFEVAGERNTADAAAALILGEVVEESRQSLAGWLADRRPCLECDHRRICGGCLAAGDGKPCHPIAHQSVTRLGQVAVQVREAWRRANAGSGRTAP